jgi:S1-C subfamily serine protease
MSDDLPETSPVLRREALLPNERSRGLGTVAVVCTMAGVASGLALATTLMAMQVADSMTTRGCPYHQPRVAYSVARPNAGFLGVTYVAHGGVIEINSVVKGSPAEAVALRSGDHVLSINGERVNSMDEMQQLIAEAGPGSTPTLIVEREGTIRRVQPTLISQPTTIRY